MKKISLKITACLLAGTLLTSSCIGSFGLFNKFAKWETEMTPNKYLNGILGWILTPIVGGVCLTVDFIVLNTIEFWTGDNPMASNIGKTQQVMGQDGRYYAVKILKKGYEITSPNGEVTLLTYDKKQNAWAMTQNGIVKELFRFNADGTIQATLANGETHAFTLDAQGVYEARMLAGDGHFFAMH